jgi:hypothetical protein
MMTAIAKIKPTKMVELYRSDERDFQFWNRRFHSQQRNYLLFP